MKKSHIAVIAALLLPAVGATFAQEANTAVTRLAWVDAEGNALAEAHISNTVYAYADTANIPDGTEVSVIIFEYNENEGLPDDYVTQLNATVQDGAIRAAWEVTYDDAQTDTQCTRELADRGWTIPRYRFRVRYAYANRRLEFPRENSATGTDEGTTYRSAFSASPTAWSWVQATLVEEHTLWTNTAYTLFVSDGTERYGVTDSKGLVQERYLPMAKLSILIRDRNDEESSGADTDTGFDAKTFWELCESGTAEEVRTAIDAGADVNARNAAGETPLITFLQGTGAYYDGPAHAAAVTFLAEHGADVNARDNGDFTALLTAAHYCPDAEIIAALLDAGAELTLGSDERHNELYTIYGREETGRSLRYLLDAGGAEGFFTLLDQGGAAEIIDQAISLGFDLDISDPRGRTPLMYAAEKNNAKTIRTLLAAGADITLRDEDGKTALDYALKGSLAYDILLAAVGTPLTPEDRGIRVVPYLTAEDLDIFIENYDVIAETLGNLDEEDDAAQEYLAAGRDVEMTDGAESFWETFTVFLNSPAPTGLENAFISIGWDADGQKKLSTILFVRTVLFYGSILDEMGGGQDNLDALSPGDRKTVEEGFEMVERFLQVFHPTDRELIRSRVDEDLL